VNPSWRSASGQRVRRPLDTRDSIIRVMVKATDRP
jgi:hypothetical protein